MSHSSFSPQTKHTSSGNTSHSERGRKGASGRGTKNNSCTTCQRLENIYLGMCQATQTLLLDKSRKLIVRLGVVTVQFSIDTGKTIAAKLQLNNKNCIPLDVFLSHSNNGIYLRTNQNVKCFEICVAIIVSVIIATVIIVMFFFYNLFLMYKILWAVKAIKPITTKY